MIFWYIFFIISSRSFLLFSFLMIYVVNEYLLWVGREVSIYYENHGGLGFFLLISGS